MSEELNLSGARNYFSQAVFNLACGTDSLQKRLRRAYDYSLKYVLTNELQDFDFKKRIDMVIAETENAPNLSDEAAASTAKEIVELAFFLKRPR
jgi:hypothetical protein